MRFALLLFVTLGASLRLTRLAATDTITEPIRVTLINAAPQRAQPWLWQLVSCPWCIGFWTSSLTTLIAALVWHLAAGNPWQPLDAYLWPGIALTIAYLVGLAGQHLE